MNFEKGILLTHSLWHTCYMILPFQIPTYAANANAANAANADIAAIADIAASASALLNW